MFKELPKEMIKIGSALLISIVIGAQILLNADGVNVLAFTPIPYFEDYESTMTGSLPSSHELIAGVASVEAGTEADGTPGKMIKALSGSLIRLTGLGDVSDLSMSFDIHDEYESAIFGVRMSPTGGSGYLAYYDPYAGVIIIYRVDGGARTELARTQIKSGGTWFRPIFEARGNELRAAVVSHDGIISGEAIAKDDAYQTGSIFLGKDAGRGGKAAHIDNLLIEAPYPLAIQSAAPTPFSATLESAELLSIDGILQHPNLDLVSGGSNIVFATQKDDSLGNILFVSGGAREAVKVSAPDDFVVSADIHDGFQGGMIGVRLSSDYKNGYGVIYHSSFPALQIVKLTDGARAVLGQASFTVPANGWNRITITVQGPSLTARTENGAEISAVDGSYGSGSIALMKESEWGNDVARFDNISVQELDSDSDGVVDSVDSCQNTVLDTDPEVSHYSWIGGAYFKTRNSKTKLLTDSSYSMVATKGCSCAQILTVTSGGNSGGKCSKGTMENFIN